MIATAAILATLGLDALVGEPPTRIHPVALFGRLAAPFDRDWQYPRAVGVIVAIGLPLAVATALGGLTWVGWRYEPVVAGALATVVLFSTTSLRALLTAGSTVVDATDSDLDAARSAAPALVGRDPSALSPGQLRSAAVESVAENLADGLVAPLAAFALGALVSLPVAVAAAAFVKAVNTLDSMLGYRDKPVGWASARLDDAVMWLPARLAAGLLALAALKPTALLRARSWARRPASPNSGWPMATMAAILEVTLDKPGAYVLNETAELPTTAQARRGVRTVGVAGVGAFTLAGVIAWF